MKKGREVIEMHVRVGPAVKATAARLAREDGRSLANWLERLIEAEAARITRNSTQPSKMG
jgi:predicted HicB family RNase H-like nuclease